MIKCPRCNIQQEESPQCEYCGLIFKEFMGSSRKPKTVRHKRTVLFVIILVAAGAILASFWLNSSRHKPIKKATTLEDRRVSTQSTTSDNLRTTAKELSGDVGIIKGFKDGSTKGSIITMVIFSIIGMGYFAYGKKSQQILMVICGIALMGYSYFVTGAIYIIMIGIALSALPFILGRK